MNKLVLAGATLLAVLSGPVLAADLKVKAPVYKAPPAPVSTWTGGYIGVNGGYSWGPWDSSSLAGIFPGFVTNASPKVNGWLGGFQAGYNWQLNASWVVGLEGDIQITDEHASANGTGSSTILIPPGGADFHLVTTGTGTNSWRFPWFGTFRGRVGVLGDPQTLFYLTGGLAVGEFEFSSQNTATFQTFLGATGNTPGGAFAVPVTVAGPAFSESTTRVGGTIGAGVERKFAPNWSAKVEYLYLDFGTHTFLSGTGSDTSVRLRDHIFRAGINYQFDSGPVVAKY